MPKSTRGKSTARNPLRDITSGGKRPIVPREEGGDEVALDRLLLVRSDLSNLVTQIDELVVQTLNRKAISKTGNQAVESFRHALSDMHSSLKTWVPRLQQALGSNVPVTRSQLGQSSTTKGDFANGEGTADKLGQSNTISSVSAVNGERDTSPSEEHSTDLGLIVSPSPLVSWRPGTCTVESGRQLFLLTPLPKCKLLSSKQRSSTRPRLVEFGKKDPPHEAVKRVEAKNESENELYPLLRSSDHNSSESSILLLTPCMKLSPAKARPLLDPICESSLQYDGDKTETQVSSDGSGNEFLASLASKYQEIFCLQPNQNFANQRREVDESLDWFLSPPKTCVLMEPSDRKVIPTPASAVVLATPMWKNLESTVRKGNPPGENTLKRELWTKFEAMSSSGFNFDASVQKTSKKGFLDMLEEVSCEPTGLESQDAR